MLAPLSWTSCSCAPRFEPSHATPLSLVSLCQNAGATGDEDKDQHESERSLQIGESVRLSTNLLIEQANEDPTWLRAKREIQQGLPENAALYVINSDTYPKWLHSYDSGEQRELTHHLVAYVLHFSKVSALLKRPDCYFHAVVLSRHISPGFSLVSAQRSGPVNHRSDNVANAKQQHKDTNAQLSSKGAFERNNRDTNPEDYDYYEKGLHFLVLWKFLNFLTLEDVEFSTDRVGLNVRSFLARAAGSPNTSALTHFELENAAISLLNDMLGHALNPPTRIPARGYFDAGVHLDQERAVTRLAVHFFLRVLSSAAVQQTLESAIIGARSTTSKVMLHDRFRTLVSALYIALDSLVRELPYDAPFGSQEISLSILVDDVQSVIFGRERFSRLRSEISTLLEWKRGPNVLLNGLNETFQAFAAQVREEMIVSTTRDRIVIPQQPTTGSNRGLERRWLLLPESTQIMSHDSRDNYRVVDVVQFMYEVSCVDVLLGPSERSVTIRSILPVSIDTTRAPTTLILDGQLRIFRVLPSGTSSMIATAGGWSVGDHVGSLSSDGQSLDVDLFGFAEGYHPCTDNKVAVARRVKLALRLKQGQPLESPRDLTVLVCVVVSGSAYKPPKGNDICLSETSTADRAALWSKLKWTPMSEAHAEYVAV